MPADLGGAIHLFLYCASSPAASVNKNSSTHPEGEPYTCLQAVSSSRHLIMHAEQALHSLQFPSLLLTPCQDPYTCRRSLFITASPHACQNGSPLSSSAAPSALSTSHLLPLQPTWICPSSSPRLLMPVSKDFHSLHLPTLLYPWTSHTWIQSLFIMASPPEHRRGFPRSAHSSHVAVDREPRPWMLSLFLFVSLCMLEKALHSLCWPTLFMCLLTGIHTRMHSLFIAAPPHASQNGSSLPGLHTPGYIPSSSQRLLMSTEKAFHSLHLPSLLMCLLTGHRTPGCTPSSSQHLLISAIQDSLSLCTLLLWLLTGNHTPGCIPSSSSCLCACGKRLSTHREKRQKTYIALLSSYASSQGYTHGCTPSFSLRLLIQATMDPHTLGFTHLDAVPTHHGVSS